MKTNHTKDEYPRPPRAHEIPPEGCGMVGIVNHTKDENPEKVTRKHMMNQQCDNLARSVKPLYTTKDNHSDVQGSEVMVLGGRDKWVSGTCVVREKDHLNTIIRLQEQHERERRELVETIKTVFSVYLTVFPMPRDAESKAVQEKVKQSVRALRDNLLETIATKHGIKLDKHE